MVDTAIAQVAEAIGERPSVKQMGSSDEGCHRDRSRQGRRCAAFRRRQRPASARRPVSRSDRYVNLTIE